MTQSLLFATFLTFGVAGSALALTTTVTTHYFASRRGR